MINPSCRQAGNGEASTENKRLTFISWDEARWPFGRRKQATSEVGWAGALTQSAYSSESIIKLERDSKPKSTIRGP